MEKTPRQISAETAEAYRQEKQKLLYLAIRERIAEVCKIGFTDYSLRSNEWLGGNIPVEAFFRSYEHRGYAPHAELSDIIFALKSDGFTVVVKSTYADVQPHTTIKISW